MTEGIKPRHVYVDEMHTDPVLGCAPYVCVRKLEL